MKKVLAMFLVMAGLSVFAQKEGESKEVDEEVDTMVCSHERDGQIQQQVPPSLRTELPRLASNWRADQRLGQPR